MVKLYCKVREEIIKLFFLIPSCLAGKGWISRVWGPQDSLSVFFFKYLSAMSKRPVLAGQCGSQIQEPGFGKGTQCGRSRSLTLSVSVRCEAEFSLPPWGLNELTFVRASDAGLL